MNFQLSRYMKDVVDATTNNKQVKQYINKQFILSGAENEFRETKELVSIDFDLYKTCIDTLGARLSSPAICWDSGP